MTSIPFFQVDAFADRPLTGNPAAVMPLDSWLDDALMQAIAAENNLSETAFTVPERERRRGLRPALVHADARGRPVRPRDARRRPCADDRPSRALLDAGRDPDRQPARRPARARPARRHADRGRRARARCARSACPTARPGSPTAATTRRSSSSPTRPRCAPSRPTSPRSRRSRGWPWSPRAAITRTSSSRVFVPYLGIDEDPVTGSAHAALVPYWARAPRPQRVHRAPGEQAHRAARIAGSKAIACCSAAAATR